MRELGGLFLCAAVGAGRGGVGRGLVAHWSLKRPVRRGIGSRGSRPWLHDVAAPRLGKDFGSGACLWLACEERGRRPGVRRWGQGRSFFRGGSGGARWVAHWSLKRSVRREIGAGGLRRWVHDDVAPRLGSTEAVQIFGGWRREDGPWAYGGSTAESPTAKWFFDGYRLTGVWLACEGRGRRSGVRRWGRSGMYTGRALVAHRSLKRPVRRGWGGKGLGR